MNVNEQLTCKYCKEIFNEPITLNCCVENICKRHIDELLSIDESNTFLCPFCDVKNANQNLGVNRLIQSLIENQLHKLELSSDNKLTLKWFKNEIEKLEAILGDPENYIYEEISELKRLVDLDRERVKSEIDKLANDFIQKLEAYEAKFKAENVPNVDLEQYKALIESSQKQMAEYEKFLNLFSTKIEERNEKSKQTEKAIRNLQYKINELKCNLFSNLSLTYKSTEHKFFGELLVKNKGQFLGRIKKKFENIHDVSVTALAVLPCGDFVSGDEDGMIKIWDPADRQVKQTLTGHDEMIREFFIVGNNCLISGSNDSTIKIWNINQGTLTRTLEGHTEEIGCLNVTKSGDLVSGSCDSTIKIWNIQDGSTKRTFMGHTDAVWSLVLLDNGDLVSGSMDTTIKIWDFDTGTIKRTLTGHTDSVLILFMLKDGNLVSGSSDNTIKIWSIEDGSVIRTLTGHKENLLAFKLFDNGDLVSGSADGTIKIWDVETGKIKKDLKLDSEITSLTLLPNGDLVSLSSYSIIIWI